MRNSLQPVIIYFTENLVGQTDERDVVLVGGEVLRNSVNGLLADSTEVKLPYVPACPAETAIAEGCPYFGLIMQQSICNRAGLSEQTLFRIHKRHSTNVDVQKKK